MWVLVLIYIIEGVPNVTHVGNYDDMYSCFRNREYIWEYELPEDKNRIQLVCVRNEEYVTR